MIKRLATTAVVVVIAMAGCRASTSTINVATDAVFPPFHSVDDDGHLVGFDIDLATEAVERTDHAVVFHHAESYAALFEGLLDGRYDVIAATTGITPEREARYAFTQPYFVTCLAILVRAGGDEPGHPDELVGRPVAASAGTTSARAAHRIPGATVVEMSRWRDSLAALRAREVDAVIIDEFEAVPFARDADDLEVLETPIATESYGLVLRLSDAARRDAINAALSAMRRDGTIAALRSRHGLERPSDWPVRVPE